MMQSNFHPQDDEHLKSGLIKTNQDVRVFKAVGSQTSKSPCFETVGTAIHVDY